VIVRFIGFLQDECVGIVLLMSLILFVSVIAGFWIQGLTENIWDLNAMWGGIAASATAAATKFCKCWVDVQTILLTRIPGEPLEK
jgi:hypothetical protein